MAVGQVVPKLLRARRDANTARFDPIIVRLSDWLCWEDIEGVPIEDLYPLEYLDLVRFAGCMAFWLRVRTAHGEEFHRRSSGEQERGLGPAPAMDEARDCETEATPEDTEMVKQAAAEALPYLLQLEDPAFDEDIRELAIILCGREAGGRSAREMVEYVVGTDGPATCRE